MTLVNEAQVHYNLHAREAGDKHDQILATKTNKYYKTTKTTPLGPNQIKLQMK